MGFRGRSSIHFREKKAHEESGTVFTGYREWWDQAAESWDRAKDTTYVVNDEADYRSRGLHGDANSPGARQLVEFGGLGSQSSVLEIGCGAARIGREMAAMVGEWHGADISPKMLEHARQWTEGVSNVFFHVLSGSALSMFEEASFDFVYANTVFMHLDKEDLYQYLLESHRVLKPGGRAYFDTWNLLHPDTYRLWLESQAGNRGTGKVRGRIQFSTAPELKRYLEEAGFDVIRFDEDKLLQAFCEKSTVRPWANEDGWPPFGYVDGPRNESTVTGDFEVTGWALDRVVRIEVLADGSTSLGEAALGLPRPDVGPKFPRYPEADRCGYRLHVSTGVLAAGKHTLQVIATDSAGRSTDLAGYHLGIVVAG
ncbi:MAG: methyltransferase domain-containing protein [Acidobacteria bacterium]|nr:methyltransferase domain-containing protein [Acidobacteriota bacterium]